MLKALTDLGIEAIDLLSKDFNERVKNSAMHVRRASRAMHNVWCPVILKEWEPCNVCRENSPLLIENSIGATRICYPCWREFLGL